jgi:hypothetical protein
MEHPAWTDARLDDRFDHVDRELSQLRSEMQAGFADMRSLTIRLHLGTWIPVLGLLAAIIARGG